MWLYPGLGWKRVGEWIVEKPYIHYFRFHSVIKEVVIQSFKWNNWMYASEGPLTEKCWVNCWKQHRSKGLWNYCGNIDKKWRKCELRWWQWKWKKRGKKRYILKTLRRINKIQWQIMHWVKRWGRMKDDTWVSDLVDLLGSENIHLARNKEGEADLGGGYEFVPDNRVISC